MRRSFFLICAVLVLLAIPLLVEAQQGAAPAAPAAAQGGRGPATPAPSATVPLAPRNENRHNSFLEIARAGNIELLFVGDSITDLWDDRAKDLWDSTWAPLKAANFGISGDTTQGVLWRMQNGELAGFKAKLI